MTDPNDTPALDLDAIDGRLHRWRGGWWEADESADGDVFQNAVADLGACVARIRADAERIAQTERLLALTTENARGFADLHTRCVDRLGMMEEQRREAKVRERELEASVSRYEEREAHFARVLGVADGGQSRADWDGAIRRVVEERDDAVRFRDAYKRAKAENDERFMCERDEARQERDAALARVRELEAAAQTVADATRAEERERCARVCEAMHRLRDGAMPRDCAEEIRSGREP